MRKYKINFDDAEVVSKTNDLIDQSRNGDNKATTELLSMYSEYIDYMVKRYSNKTHIKDDDDLRSIIQIGFLEGIKRYDPDKKTKFIYFAHNWMKKLIFSESNKYYRLIRLPVNQSNFQKDFQKKYPDIEDLEMSLYKSENVLDLHIHDKNYLKFRQLEDTVACNFIDKNFYEEEFDSNSALDTTLIVEPETFKKEVNSILKCNIAKVLSIFNVEETYILEHAFGLNGKPKISIDQISIDLQMSAINIINIKNKIIRLLRHNSFRDILFNGL